VAVTEDDDPPLPAKPPLARATAAFLAECRGKNRAYDEQQRRRTEAWHRRLAGLADEPEPEEESPAHSGPDRTMARIRAGSSHSGL
jgi:hypothetical protein